MRFVVKVFTLSYMSLMVLFVLLPLKCHCETTDSTVISIPTDESFRRYFRKLSSRSTNRSPSIVDLRRREIKCVPEEIFRRNETEMLVLENNKLTDLPSELANLTNLGYINLVDNRITDISLMRVVNDLPNLESLVVSRNPLTSLNGLRVNSLQTLEADYCEIHEIGDAFLETLPSLKILNLTGNPLSTVRKLISENLTELVLTDCKITELPNDTFKGLLNLKYLNLADNNLSTLPDDIFSNNNNLVYLNLRKNILKILKQVWFDNKRRLHDLFLSNNEINLINETSFAELSGLYDLDLSDNRLVGLSRINTTAVNVNLAKNSIVNQKLWDLTGMDKLRNLDLSRNKMNGHCDEFKSKTLRILDLGDNNLTRLRRNSFSNVPNLMELNLKGNKFSHGEDLLMFDDNKILEDVELGDNPWNCNCTELFPIYDFMVRGKRSSSQSLVCWTPNSVKGDTWWSVCSNEWKPFMMTYDQSDVSKTWLIVISILFGVCLLVGSMFYVVYTFKKNHWR